MIRNSVLTAIVIGCFSGVVFADESPLSYDYVGVGYLDIDVDGAGFSGFGVFGSTSITESAFIYGDYATAESNDKYGTYYFSDNIDINELNFGFGFHVPVNATTDFVGTIAYVKAEIEADAASFSAEGKGHVLSVGARTRATNKLELEFVISHADIEDTTETGYGFDARFYANKQASFGLGYATSDDVDTIGFDVKFDF